MAAVSALVSAAAETSDYFWIDDVFVTGILRTKTEKVRYFFEVKHVFDFVKTTCLALYHVVLKCLGKSCDVLFNFQTREIKLYDWSMAFLNMHEQAKNEVLQVRRNMDLSIWSHCIRFVSK